MTLEDFEKSLAQEKATRRDSDHPSSKHDHDGLDRHRSSHQSHHRHHHHRHHSDRKRHRSRDGDEEYEPRHRHKRYHRDGAKGDEASSRESHGEVSEDVDPESSNLSGVNIQRDAWMEGPSSLDVEMVHKPVRPEPGPKPLVSSQNELRIHEKEINKQYFQDQAAGKRSDDVDEVSAIHEEVRYSFGDSGSQWRMTKLRAVYRKAEEQGRRVDEVAEEQFGDLKSFDDAREEELELDRRSRYGSDYVGKEKPSGDLYQERRVEESKRRTEGAAENGGSEYVEVKALNNPGNGTTTLALDQTALNRLKAKMMKAKLRGGPEAEKLETEYNTALAGFANGKQPEVIVLGAMENRMLAGNRNGEVKAVDNKRGRERGLVVENESMSIDDMVREERRTRGQAGGDGLRLAERIAKDGKFDNDLDYMDENASKLAKRVHKSEINLKSTAISDFRKMNQILDNCPLCHHEDTDKPPTAPIVSLATRTYLTLPTDPEISDGGACIIPIQHRKNLLECDDDEWEEIRNFMKSLTRMYHDQGRAVVFYENAATPHKHRHAGMEAVPLPYSLGDIASQFFKEAILTADEEWTQHKKIIDTRARAKDGLGKLAFRRTLAKEMPYFHVWFEIDGGLGHIVEDSNRWPKGDLFAREILGGMLDKGPEVIKKQGRWRRDDARVEDFRKRWKKFDWTRILMDG